MLREKILPTGIGHTTNCFLQVEGSDSEEGYILTESEPDRPKSVQVSRHRRHLMTNFKVIQVVENFPSAKRKLTMKTTFKICT